MIPNRQTERFLNRKWVRAELNDVTLTAIHIQRLNRLFSVYRCKEIEDMHCTIVKMVVNDLTNYLGRIRRLRGIPGTSRYTQLLRYGKVMYTKIYQEQTDRKTKHFPNKISYWLGLGYSEEAAMAEVKKIQQCRNVLAVEKTSGTSMYSCRSVSFWMLRGLTESEAVAKVRQIQTQSWKDHTTEEREDRIAKWLSTLASKSESEKEIINTKKSHSVAGHLARGKSLNDAEAGYAAFCLRMRAKKNQSWSKISQELFARLDEKLGGETYYQTKNYEYLIGDYRVDYYRKDTKTVIEFYGDYFHRNPQIFAADMVSYGYLSSDKWLSDANRIARIKESTKVDQVIIIWELDFRLNPTAVVDSIIHQIGEQR